MSAVTKLLREDLLEFAGYQSARSEEVDGTIWLNANESPWPNAADACHSLRRYPEPQPEALRRALARMYGCRPEQLLIGRGSDEPIDLLVRAFCVPGRDAVLVTPPVFGMYAVCARLQGARLVEVPLRDAEEDFLVDLDTVADVTLAQGAKLVFLCSPGNPAGGVLAVDAVLALTRQLEDRALVVVDEAYVEFSDQLSLVPEVARHSNLAVLRTLSKAHALAAARIGSVIADVDVIDVLRRCQAPYPVPRPCAEQALRALAPAARIRTETGIAEVHRERERLRAALNGMACVRRVYPSQANFLLVRLDDAEAAYHELLAAGIVVRDMRATPQLADALRISIGTPAHNTRVIAVLQSLAEAA